MFIHTLVKYTYVCRKILIIVRRQTFYEEIPEEREREKKKRKRKRRRRRRRKRKHFDRRFRCKVYFMKTKQKTRV